MKDTTIVVNYDDVKNNPAAFMYTPFSYDELAVYTHIRKVFDSYGTKKDAFLGKQALDQLCSEHNIASDVANKYLKSLGQDNPDNVNIINLFNSEDMLAKGMYHGNKARRITLTNLQHKQNLMHLVKYNKLQKKYVSDKIALKRDVMVAMMLMYYPDMDGNVLFTLYQYYYEGKKDSFNQMFLNMMNGGASQW